MTIADEITKLLKIVFDRAEDAERWMMSPNSGFGGGPPRELVELNGEDALAIKRHLMAWSVGGPFTSPIAGVDEALLITEVEFDPEIVAEMQAIADRHPLDADVGIIGGGAAPGPTSEDDW